jgi:uncharacterized protein (DUF2252 family)
MAKPSEEFARPKDRSDIDCLDQARARQMETLDGSAWSVELKRNRSMSPDDAPSWLRACVVDLVAIHEQASLKHCRRYALAA